MAMYRRHNPPGGTNPFTGRGLPSSSRPGGGFGDRSSHLHGPSGMHGAGPSLSGMGKKIGLIVVSIVVFLWMVAGPVEEDYEAARYYENLQQKNNNIQSHNDNNNNNDGSSNHLGVDFGGEQENSNGSPQVLKLPDLESQQYRNDGNNSNDHDGGDGQDGSDTNDVVGGANSNNNSQDYSQIHDGDNNDSQDSLHYDHDGEDVGDNTIIHGGNADSQDSFHYGRDHDRGERGGGGDSTDGLHYNDSQASADAMDRFHYRDSVASADGESHVQAAVVNTVANEKAAFGSSFGRDGETSDVNLLSSGGARGNSGDFSRLGNESDGSDGNDDGGGGNSQDTIHYHDRGDSNPSEDFGHQSNTNMGGSGDQSKIVLGNTNHSGDYSIGNGAGEESFAKSNTLDADNHDNANSEFGSNFANSRDENDRNDNEGRSNSQDSFHYQHRGNFNPSDDLGQQAHNDLGGSDNQFQNVHGEVSNDSSNFESNSHAIHSGDGRENALSRYSTFQSERGGDVSFASNNEDSNAIQDFGSASIHRSGNLEGSENARNSFGNGEDNYSGKTAEMHANTQNSQDTSVIKVNDSNASQDTEFLSGKAEKSGDAPGEINIQVLSGNVESQNSVYKENTGGLRGTKDMDQVLQQGGGKLSVEESASAGYGNQSEEYGKKYSGGLGEDNSGSSYNHAGKSSYAENMGSENTGGLRGTKDMNQVLQQGEGKLSIEESVSAGYGNQSEEYGKKYSVGLGEDNSGSSDNHAGKSSYAENMGSIGNDGGSNYEASKDELSSHQVDAVAIDNDTMIVSRERVSGKVDETSASEGVDNIESTGAESHVEVDSRYPASGSDSKLGNSEGIDSNGLESSFGDNKKRVASNSLQYQHEVLEIPQASDAVNHTAIASDNKGNNIAENTSEKSGLNESESESESGSANVVGEGLAQHSGMVRGFNTGVDAQPAAFNSDSQMSIETKIGEVHPDQKINNEVGATGDNGSPNVVKIDQTHTSNLETKDQNDGLGQFLNEKDSSYSIGFDKSVSDAGKTILDGGVEKEGNTNMGLNSGKDAFNATDISNSLDEVEPGEKMDRDNSDNSDKSVEYQDAANESSERVGDSGTRSSKTGSIGDINASTSADGNSKLDTLQVDIKKNLDLSNAAVSEFISNNDANTADRDQMGGDISSGLGQSASNEGEKGTANSASLEVPQLLAQNVEDVGKTVITPEETADATSDNSDGNIVDNHSPTDKQSISDGESAENVSKGSANLSAMLVEINDPPEINALEASLQDKDESNSGNLLEENSGNDVPGEGSPQDSEPISIKDSEAVSADSVQGLNAATDSQVIEPENTVDVANEDPATDVSDTLSPGINTEKMMNVDEESSINNLTVESLADELNLPSAIERRDEGYNIDNASADETPAIDSETPKVVITEEGSLLDPLSMNDANQGVDVEPDPSAETSIAKGEGNNLSGIDTRTGDRNSIVDEGSGGSTV